jgi:Cu(I)/Ag(I) efflux system membrane fusion protein
MKYLGYILILISLIACGDKGHKNHDDKKGDYYTCPMHPEIVRYQPGQCPICGMDLVRKSNAEVQKIYTCPMHPEIIRDKPGKCPICGMDLVEKKSQGASITDTSLQFLLKTTNKYVVSQIKTVTLEQKELSVEFSATGRITYDTRQVSTVSARVEGRIEKLYIKFRFQPIRKGEKLMDIYSKELVTEQENYIFLLNNDAENKAIISAAESKLSLLGLTKGQIQSLKQFKKVFTTISVYSPANGHLHDIQEVKDGGEMLMAPTQNEEPSIHEGMYVQKGQTVFNIYNTDRVWAVLDVYTERQNTLKIGQPIKLFVDGTDDTITAKIDFIEPEISRGKKSVSARVYLDNSNGNLKVGSIVKGTFGSEKKNGLFLPAKSVLGLGINNVVFVMNGKLFETRKVELGIRTDGWVEIISGLDKKELVAENAQLLIDSEAFVKVNSK